MIYKGFIICITVKINRNFFHEPTIHREKKSKKLYIKFCKIVQQSCNLVTDRPYTSSINVYYRQYI